MAKVARAEQMLTKLGDKLGLTSEGKEWIIGALDPFHDTPLDICGFPDGTIDPVCTQIVKQSFNISCPSGITTGTWDCQIIALPWAKPIKLATQSALGGTDSNPTSEVYHTPSATSATYGGITYISVPTGTTYNPNGFTVGTTATIIPNGIPDQYLVGDARIIGKGFEVHNTTSELNIQGMATTWSIPMPSITQSSFCDSYLLTGSTASNNAFGNFLQIPMWPISQTSAILTPGSRQWIAKEGAYIVSRLNTMFVPVSDSGAFIQPFVTSTDSSVPSNNVASIGTSSTLAPSQTIFGGVYWDNFDMSGVLFSGLSLSTTLTVNFIYIIERHPDTTISDLVVLARPPPERCDVALELYTHVSRALPSGVPVAMNGLGDWFMDALSTAADFVAPVLSAIPGVPGLVGQGIGLLNSSYKNSKSKASYETNPTVRPQGNSFSNVVQVRPSQQKKKNKPKSTVVIEEIVRPRKGGKSRPQQKPRRKPQLMLTQ